MADFGGEVVIFACVLPVQIYSDTTKQTPIAQIEVATTFQKKNGCNHLQLTVFMYGSHIVLIGIHTPHTSRYHEWCCIYTFSCPSYNNKLKKNKKKKTQIIPQRLQMWAVRFRLTWVLLWFINTYRKCQVCFFSNVFCTEMPGLYWVNKSD